MMAKLKIFKMNTGSCNGCDIEILDALLSPRFKLKKYEIEIVEKPEEADLIILSGPITLKMRKFVAEIKKKANGKKIIAVGSCGVEGGIWFDSFATYGGIDKMLDVDVFIPGCPVKPEAVIYGIAIALGLESPRIKRVEYQEP